MEPPFCGLSRSACSSVLAAQLRGSGTGPGIDLLSYMITRRFVFPQPFIENREKLPEMEQPFEKFILLAAWRRGAVDKVDGFWRRKPVAANEPN